jgi:hypothetical protein
MACNEPSELCFLLIDPCFISRCKVGSRLYRLSILGSERVGLLQAAPVSSRVRTIEAHPTGKELARLIQCGAAHGMTATMTPIAWMFYVHHSFAVHSIRIPQLRCA